MISADPAKAITRWPQAHRVRRHGSARPDVSSPCIRSTDATTYNVAISHSIPTVEARHASVMPDCPPMRWKTARASSLSPTRPG